MDSKAFPEPSASEIKKLKAEGVKEAIKESTKDAYKAGADQGYGDEGDDPDKRVITKTADIMQLLPLLDTAADALEEALDGGPNKDGLALSEGQIAGLLEAERSGKNRTEWVKVLCKRLGIDSPYEVTDAGPAYTNDTSSAVVKR